MEINIRAQMLKSIGNIFEKSKYSRLESQIFIDLDGDLAIVASYLKCTKTQAFIVALIFTLNYKGETVDFKDIIEHINCNPIRLFELSDDFEELHSKGILKRMQWGKLYNGYFTNDQFSISKEITQAILANKPLPVTEKETFTSIIDILDRINRIGKNVQNFEVSSEIMILEVCDLLRCCEEFPLIKRVNHLLLDAYDSFLFYFVVWKALNGTETMELSSVAELIYDNANERINYIQQLVAGNNSLIKHDLIDVVDASFINDTEIKLSNNAINMLREEGLTLITAKMNNSSKVNPQSIMHKELFFNPSETTSLNLLYELLREDNLKRVQGRMREKNLPSGITVLLHGYPGTGKSETAYQVAKATNREIIYIDISQTKSMWYGESQKIVKKIFNEYREYSKQCSITPILLLNEADAVISKRRDSDLSGTAQTENAIQNIILEELENFKGIFLATTNLINNIDPAFERRFLFKIEFHKPTPSVKAKIWQSKMPNLSASECQSLAERFDFSGGQIDNIVRKSEMHEIIFGTPASIEKLIEFCNSELFLGLKSKGIGFGKRV